MTETSPLRALVVDDEVLIRQAVARALTQEGFVCEIAADGRQALERLRERSFDVAISDVRMPEMNGHTLVVEMLAMADPPAIVVLTGVAEPRIVKDLLARGVDDVVAKPANYDLLVLKAKALAQRRRSKAEEPTSLAAPPPERDAPKAKSFSPDDVELRQSDQVAAQLSTARHNLAAPPADYDAFRLASGDIFGIADLTKAIQCKPAVAGEVLLLANCILFRATEVSESQAAPSTIPSTTISTSPNLNYFVAGSALALGLILGALLGFTIG